MARMHTGKHGKSKSRKPAVEMGTVPEGVTLTAKEIEQLALEYAKKGMAQAMIGQTLKDEHNVPYIRQVMGKRLGVILKQNKAQGELPPDMLDLMKKATVLRKHLEKNHGDMHNKTSLIRTEAKIWRLSKYYKREGMLPDTWKYEPAKVALMIKGS